jgi:hypothetical protein
LKNIGEILLIDSLSNPAGALYDADHTWSISFQERKEAKERLQILTLGVPI